MALATRCGMLDDLAAQLATLTKDLERFHGDDPQVTRTRHDAGNALAAARASLEAIADGVLEPTQDRMRNLKRSLDTARALLR